jgi:hypothetical protein
MAGISGKQWEEPSERVPLELRHMHSSPHRWQKSSGGMFMDQIFPIGRQVLEHKPPLGFLSHWAPSKWPVLSRAWWWAYRGCQSALCWSCLVGSWPLTPISHRSLQGCGQVSCRAQSLLAEVIYICKEVQRTPGKTGLVHWLGISEQ